ncbi:hypothetical protein GCM10008949_23660 [Deinococcus humi]|nr:hypothetical protein GCM10008949_23660 [Deinococcus humi]
MLGCFQGKASTVAAAAGTLDVDLRVVHRDVTNLLAAGLLRIERAEPRAGRAVRWYRAASDAYFVPFHATRAISASRLEERFTERQDARFREAFVRAFERALEEQSPDREWGLRVYFDGERAQVDEGYADAELRGAITGWQGPTGPFLMGSPEYRLTPEQTREAQVTLIRLMGQLQSYHQENKRVGRGAPVLVRVGVAPLDEDVGG